MKTIGFLEKIIFENEQGFRICKFRTIGNDVVTIKGNLLLLKPFQKYELTYKVESNDKFNSETYDVLSIKLIMPTSYDEIYEYLISPLFPTIGDNFVNKLYENFGDKLLTKIMVTDFSDYDFSENDLMKVAIIKNTLKDINDEFEIINKFKDNNINWNIFLKLKMKFSLSQIIEVIKHDPYIHFLNGGIRFLDVDKLFITFNPNLIYSDLRLKYLLWNIVNGYIFKTANTYLLKEELLELINQSTDFKNTSPENIENIFANAINDGLIVNVDERISTSFIFETELNIKKELIKLVDKNVMAENDSNFSDFLEDNYNILYNYEQKAAIKAAMKYPVSLITGGPGTGKTTIVKGLVKIYKKFFNKLNVTLCAPTGKAANRLGKAAEHNAYTIHKILKFSEIEKFSENYNNKSMLDIDVLIIDEMSMVDTEMFGALLNSIPNLQKIILIGDPYQLPSIGPGNIFQDIISSDAFNVVNLKEVFRQNEGNDIIELAYNIKEKNTLLNLRDNYKDNINFFPLNNPYEILDKIKSILKEELKHNSFDNIQVVTPMHNGLLGVQNVNNYIQSIFNLNNMMIKNSKYLLKLNDKVMQLKNWSDENIYNGDVGFIEKIYKNEKNKDTIIVRYDDIKATYTKEVFDQIALAYANTVHKLQGSEYNIIIFIAHNSLSRMYSNNLIYTAITRAKSHIYILGEESVFLNGILNVNNPRKTNLNIFLKELI